MQTASDALKQAAERPILFNAAMVRAVLAGTKTQTRRVVKAARDPNIGCWMTPGEIALDSQTVQEHISPYGKPGDRLWVRETFCDAGEPPDPTKGRRYYYRADYAGQPFGANAYGRWKPSIHMPRAASRITLKITGVRVERLQDISEADAAAEGVAAKVTNDCSYSAREAFVALWESINGGGSWDANPWVWCVEFKRLEQAA